MQSSFEKFANINLQQTDNKKTPLMYAALYGRKDLVTLFLEAGENKELKNDSNFTAKQLAEIEGHMEIVKILT